IVSGSSGTAAAKKEALEAAGVKVGKTPSETAGIARSVLETADHREEGDGRAPAQASATP
ncbi:hypothetical protein SAMN05421803_1291, partial [Nocardiopsis flavescens]